MNDLIYTKNYVKWNSKKMFLDQRILPEDFFFLEGEVWWAMLGVNVGHEIDGKNELFERPILVFKKQSEDMLFALPITSKYKVGDKFYLIKYRGEVRTVLLDQLRTISSKRLLRFIYRITNEEFQMIHLKMSRTLIPIKAKPPD